MNRYTKSLLALLFSFVTTAAIAADPQETYTFDPNHTYVEFEISHFGFSNPSGKWFANGTLNLDPNNPKNNHVKATIKTADITTGIPELDKHLKEELFFDVQKYPTATFESTQVKMNGKSKATVEGMLTLKGITKPVTLNVDLNKQGMNPISNKMTVGYTAHTTLKRSDFGITTLLPGLGDEVKIRIEVEANR